MYKTVTAVVALYAYLNQAVLGNTRLRMRATDCFGGGRPWWPDWLVGSDIFRATLLMLGSVGVGTRLHVDWTEALNIALAIDGYSDLSLALALWMFVSPAALERVHRALIDDKQFLNKAGKRRFPKGLSSNEDVQEHLLSKAEMEYLAAKFPDGVMLVEQFAGEVVIVRPGWLHAVINLQPCLKLAFDRYVPEAFPQYAMSHVLVASKYGMVADDYMQWPTAAMEYVIKALVIKRAQKGGCC